jgi:outer membrane translocation and assembly module TamA
MTANLREAGYAYVQVAGKVTVDRDRHQAVVEYRVTPGPLVHLGSARLVGAGEIPEWKLRRRLTWNPGDRYDPDHIATTQGRLYDLGVFSTVRIELPPEPTPNPDVTVNVSPGKLHEVRLGAGVGVDTQRQEVRLRGEWWFSNFLGGLRKLRLQAKPAWAVIPSVLDPRRSGPVAEVQAQLTQPDLFGTSVTGQATAGYDLMLTEGYAAQGPRGSLGVRRSFWRDRILAGLGWNLQFLDFYDINTDVFDPNSTTLGLGFKDPYRLAYAEEFVQLDLSDRVRSGRVAGFIGLRFEQGSQYLGGQFRYNVIVPEVKLLVPLGRRVVLAGRGLAGGLWPVGNAASDSPVTRRFRLGGPSSHRGFSYGRLAPQFADQSGGAIPVGGDGELLLSAEVRVEIVQLGGGWVSLAPFFDAGDVTVEFSALSLRRLHQAAGLAATYATPIGIVRAGAAMRLNRLNGTVTPGQALDNPDPGQRFAFHITIGEAF